MIIVWFFKYIKYRYLHKKYRNYAHPLLQPLTLRQYIGFSRAFRKKYKAKFLGDFTYADTDSIRIDSTNRKDFRDIYPNTIFGKSTDCLHGGYTTIGKEKTND